MSYRSSKGVKGLVKIYVTPETAYHLNQMLFQLKGLKYLGEVVDKIIRSMMTERRYTIKSRFSGFFFLGLTSPFNGYKVSRGSRLSCESELAR